MVSVLEPGGKHYGMSSASRRAPAREAQATSKADSLVARSTTSAALGCRRSAGLGDLEFSPVGDMDRGSKTRGLMEGAFGLLKGRNAASCPTEKLASAGRSF